jgi:hypothetical protein
MLKVNILNFISSGLNKKNKLKMNTEQINEIKIVGEYRHYDKRYYNGYVIKTNKKYMRVMIEANKRATYSFKGFNDLNEQVEKEYFHGAVLQDEHVHWDDVYNRATVIFTTERGKFSVTIACDIYDDTMSVKTNNDVDYSSDEEERVIDEGVYYLIVLGNSVKFHDFFVKD